MESAAEEQQLLRSCAILFGPDLHLSREFLEYLQLSGLKGAYHKRALETHPDRFFSKDRLQRQGSIESFHSIRNAYEDLLQFLQARERYALREKFCQAAATYHASKAEGSADGPSSFFNDIRGNSGYSATDNLYSGPLPHRRLLFGHFLYYSGLANWRTITRILTWQRTERPRIGELSRRFGMLQPEDISFILRNRVPFQPFGQTAMNLGMLSELQIRVLIFHQQRLQKKFGTILLEKQLVTQQELQQLLYEFSQHNLRCGDKRT
jgi:hypothetical protein